MPTATRFRSLGRLGLCFAALALTAGAVRSAPAANPDDFRSAVAPHGDTITATHHQARMGGKLISYTAYAGLLPIYVNDTGERMATMFFVAYVADGQSSKGRRPITFLWNGGPGSNSAQVHIVGFGPKRVVTADTYPEYTNTQTRIADNPESWLGTSDLVFVDPVGTGFSRAQLEHHRHPVRCTAGFGVGAQRLRVKSFPEGAAIEEVALEAEIVADIVVEDGGEALHQIGHRREARILPE